MTQPASLKLWNWQATPTTPTTPTGEQAKDGDPTNHEDSANDRARHSDQATPENWNAHTTDGTDEP